jgi:hypothetical protein
MSTAARVGMFTPASVATFTGGPHIRAFRTRDLSDMARNSTFPKDRLRQGDLSNCPDKKYYATRLMLGRTGRPEDVLETLHISEKIKRCYFWPNPGGVSMKDADEETAVPKLTAAYLHHMGYDPAEAGAALGAILRDFRPSSPRMCYDVFDGTPTPNLVPEAKRQSRLFDHFLYSVSSFLGKDATSASHIAVGAIRAMYSEEPRQLSIISRCPDRPIMFEAVQRWLELSRKDEPKTLEPQKTSGQIEAEIDKVCGYIIENKEKLKGYKLTDGRAKIIIQSAHQIAYSKNTAGDQRTVFVNTATGILAGLAPSFGLSSLIDIAIAISEQIQDGVIMDQAIREDFAAEEIIRPLLLLA